MAWTLVLIVVTKKESSQLSPVLVDNLESTTGVSSEGSFSRITEPCASFYLHMIPDKFGNETLWTVARFDGIENKPPTFDGDFTSQNYTLVSSGGPYNFRVDFFVNDNEVTIDTNRYEMIEATLCGAPCSEPGCWMGSMICMPCTQYKLRHMALNWPWTIFMQ